uniref:CYP4CD1 n=1 Tax=Liposcelis bostrychophila TaxID=185214 RepID=B6DEP2_LIPBO|nr:CYP4CD1 [Liposcelis bostrychophila]
MVLHGLFVTFVCATLIYVLERIIHRRVYKAEKQFDGPPGYWFFGNSFDFINKSSKEIFDQVVENLKTYGNGRFYKIRIMHRLGIACSDHRDMEVILGSNTLIDKGVHYHFILPWIGFGPLTSNGSRWRKHRKIITPTFHFKILEQFIDVFNKNGAIMCEKMEKEVNGEPFNVYNYVNLAALDNIFESAMGINMNVQKNSETTYVRAIKEMCNVVNKRVFWWILRIYPIFRLSKYYKMQTDALNVLHSTTVNIIEQRKKELAVRKKLEKDDEKDEEIEFYQKKRMAFLDLLLESAEASNISDEDIRQEVDTFMFEGHDTISSGLSFALWALANNPDVQQKVYEEQMEIFGDSNRPPTFNDLQNMKYLERTLKESQRLFPSVPMITRKLNEDVDLPGGYHLPKGTNVGMIIYSLHRDPKVWPNPEKFDPDNFTPDAIQGRNPYSYVPFSAGPRNCIGQKFAMLEMKSTVSKVVRQYKLLPSPYEKHKLQLTSELVLMSLSGVHVKIQRRSNSFS